jgi:hypothetical protein
MLNSLFTERLMFVGHAVHTACRSGHTISCFFLALSTRLDYLRASVSMSLALGILWLHDTPDF